MDWPSGTKGIPGLMKDIDQRVSIHSDHQPMI